jgi:hypothetical protein
MTARPLETDTILVGTPLPNGTMVLVPRYARVRSCHRLDGTAKVAFRSRSDARKSSRKHHDVYRCGFCGSWHLATKRKRIRPDAEATGTCRPMTNAA